MCGAASATRALRAGFAHMLDSPVTVRAIEFLMLGICSIHQPMKIREHRH
jgi:hypothetical protein